MGRHTQPKCKLCRRAGEKLFLKGERCASAKCSFDKRSYAPGQHGQRGRMPSKISEYGRRLREKQKARRLYGLTETQFRRYFALASKRKGATGERLLELLERRLDNVVYRSGFSSSRNQARQIIKHGQILVSGRKVDIPSFQTKVDLEITLKPKMNDKIKAIIEKAGDKTAPGWLSVDTEALKIKVAAIPTREEIDSSIEENLIVEFYSR